MDFNPKISSDGYILDYKLKVRIFTSKGLDEVLIKKIESRVFDEVCGPDEVNFHVYSHFPYIKEITITTDDIDSENESKLWDPVFKYQFYYDESADAVHEIFEDDLQGFGNFVLSHKDGLLSIESAYYLLDESEFSIDEDSNSTEIEIWERYKEKVRIIQNPEPRMVLKYFENEGD